MKTLLSCIFMVLTSSSIAAGHTCLNRGAQEAFDRLKWAPTETLVLDSGLVNRLNQLLEQNEGTCIIELIYTDVIQADMQLKNQQWLTKYLEDASRIMNAAEQHKTLWNLLANIADIRFNELMNRLNSSIEAHEIDDQTFETRYAIQRLAEHGYSISLTPSLWEKLTTYIKDGRWDHISRSVWTTHRDVFFKGLAFIALISLAIFFTIKMLVKKYTLAIKIKRRHENSF